MQLRLDKAKAEGYEEAEKRILDIIDWEKQRLYWWQLNFKMGKSKGRSASTMTDEGENGDVQEFEGKLNA